METTAQETGSKIEEFKPLILDYWGYKKGMESREQLIQEIQENHAKQLELQGKGNELYQQLSMYRAYETIEEMKQNEMKQHSKNIEGALLGG